MAPIARVVQQLASPLLARKKISKILFDFPGKMATLDKLFQTCQEKVDDTGNKVTVVGVGQVGMAAVFSLLTQVRNCILCLYFSLKMPLLLYDMFRLITRRLRAAPRLGVAVTVAVVSSQILSSVSIIKCIFYLSCD